MLILSLDPGIEKTGFALIKEKSTYKKFDFITSGLIKTKKNLPIEKRIFIIYQSLEKIIHQYRPSVIVYEEIFFFKNRKTIISVSQMQGIILLLAAANKIAVKKLSPLMIKQAITGYGLADKKAIKKMIDNEIKLKLPRTNGRGIFKNASSELKSAEAENSYSSHNLTIKEFREGGLKKKIEDDEYDAIACGLTYCFLNKNLIR